MNRSKDMKMIMMISTTLLALAFSQPALAANDHNHMHAAMHGDKGSPGSMDGMHSDMPVHQADGLAGMMKDAFLVKKEIDGYTVSFHIMKAKVGMAHGASHHATGMSNEAAVPSHHSIGLMNGTAESRPQGEGQDTPSHHSTGLMNGTAESRPQGEGQDAPSHNVMIKIEKDGKAITDLVANSKATHPNGQSESKMMMQMGDWYMAAYDLGHPGQHQVMVLFKTADGVKHFGGIDYPESK